MLIHEDSVNKSINKRYLDNMLHRTTQRLASKCDGVNVGKIFVYSIFLRQRKQCPIIQIFLPCKISTLHELPVSGFIFYYICFCVFVTNV